MPRLMLACGDDARSPTGTSATSNSHANAGATANAHADAHADDARPRTGTGGKPSATSNPHANAGATAQAHADARAAQKKTGAGRLLQVLQEQAGEVVLNSTGTFTMELSDGSEFELPVRAHDQIALAQLLAPSENGMWESKSMPTRTLTTVSELVESARAEAKVASAGVLGECQRTQPDADTPAPPLRAACTEAAAAHATPRTAAATACPLAPLPPPMFFDHQYKGLSIPKGAFEVADEQSKQTHQLTWGGDEVGCVVCSFFLFFCACLLSLVVFALCCCVCVVIVCSLVMYVCMYVLQGGQPLPMDKLEPAPKSSLQHLTRKQKLARDAMKQRLRNRKSSERKKAGKAQAAHEKKKAAEAKPNKKRRITVEEIESDDD